MGRVNRGPYARQRIGQSLDLPAIARSAPCSSRLVPWWLPKVSEAVDPQPRALRPGDASASRVCCVWGRRAAGRDRRPRRTPGRGGRAPRRAAGAPLRK